jgi:hypothetical protein
MHGANNYSYRSNPFDWGGGTSAWEYGGGDYLFAYWMARKWGVIPAGE